MKTSRYLPLNALLGMWCFSFIGWVSLAIPIIGVYALAYLVRQRRFVAAAMLLIANPVSVVFLCGVIAYANGNACLRYVGHPGTTSHNLDPELRCGRSFFGCIVMENEWVTQAPYNLAVRFLTACFGWMPNTYTGPYPTETDARNALIDGSAFSIDDLAQNRLVINGAAIALDEGVGPELVERLKLKDRDVDKPPLEITASIWQDECLLLRIPVPWSSENTSPSAVIVVISRSAGRPFAYYPEGSYSHHFPPVTWKRRPAQKTHKG